MKAKDIQWRYEDQFQDLGIRLRGFHIALNFLALIGEKFNESSLEDILIESGLCGSCRTQALLQGKPSWSESSQAVDGGTHETAVGSFPVLDQERR